jgi:hypothetical protein
MRETTKRAAEKSLLLDKCFEGARLSAAPTIEFKGFTACLKACPFKA